MAAGPKRNRLTIQQNRPTRGSDGGPVDSWVTLATVWAEAVTLKGVERWMARQVQEATLTIWRVRYSSLLADLTGSVRVIFKGRVFHLKDVTDVDERRKTIEMTCEEATDQSEYPLALADQQGEPLLDQDSIVLEEP